MIRNTGNLILNRENKVYEKIKKNELPLGTNIISGKWVYKVKPTSTGEVSIFKSRIVARGFQGRLKFQMLKESKLTVKHLWIIWRTLIQNQTGKQKNWI